MDPIPSEEALSANHVFPGPYQFKAIGAAEGGFPARVVAAATRALEDPGELEHSVRTTQGGRHSAVTLVVQARSAAQVRAIYANLREVEGLSLLL